MCIRDRTTGAFAVAQPPSSFQDKTSSSASQVSPADLSNIGIEQRLDQQVPLDLQFKNETGKTVQLGDYFKSGRPVLLNLVYYTCPMLCGAWGRCSTRGSKERAGLT